MLLTCYTLSLVYAYMLHMKVCSAVSHYSELLENFEIIFSTRLGKFYISDCFPIRLRKNLEMITFIIPLAKRMLIFLPNNSVTQQHYVHSVPEFGVCIRNWCVNWCVSTDTHCTHTFRIRPSSLLCSHTSPTEQQLVT